MAGGGERKGMGRIWTPGIVGMFVGIVGNGVVPAGMGGIVGI